MAEAIDEAKVIAWLDGELDAAEAARVARAVADDPSLREAADAHRAIKTRFDAAFGPIAEEPAAMPVLRGASVISLASVRSAREATAARPERRWIVPGAIAASLMAGFLIGHGDAAQRGVGDRRDAVALAEPLSRAFDQQLAGEMGPVRIALSFRDQGGSYCRSFTGTHIAGVACRDAEGWQLRYAAPGSASSGDYRMAGGDAARGDVIGAMIAGAPLDAAAERKARAAGWR
ncbi:MAG TPA: hypothetical protein VNT42_08700 [Sphingomonas sp.]|nr:hypothetical protein [Sphingomonas sp.]